MKKLLIAIALLLFGVSLSACGKSNEYERQINEINSVSRENQFIVGLECAYQPFNWTEDKSTSTNIAIYNMKNKFAEGYDIQMAKKIAEGLGKTLVIKAIEWDSLIPELTTNHIDAIIAGMSNTEERRESVNFTNAYYTSEEVCLVLKTGSYANATSINDFSGATAIGQKGTLYGDLVKQLTNANIGAELDTVPEIITAMTYGRCDVTVVEKPVALGLINSNPNLKIIEFEGTNGFQVSEEDVAVCIALRKTDTSLRDDINTILEGISIQERETLMATAVNNN